MMAESIPARDAIETWLRDNDARLLARVHGVCCETDIDAELIAYHIWRNIKERTVDHVDAVLRLCIEPARIFRVPDVMRSDPTTLHALHALQQNPDLRNMMCSAMMWLMRVPVEGFVHASLAFHARLEVSFLALAGHVARVPADRLRLDAGAVMTKQPCLPWVPAPSHP